MKACPLCGTKALKVIYLGFPMLLCEDDGCSCLYGAWSWIANLFLISDGEHFWFLGYEGNYFRALWYWLRGMA